MTEAKKPTLTQRVTAIEERHQLKDDAEVERRWREVHSWPPISRPTPEKKPDKPKLRISRLGAWRWRAYSGTVHTLVASAKTRKKLVRKLALWHLGQAYAIDDKECTHLL